MQLKGKKVLVTGSDGFIGSHLVERLLDEGSNVRAYVLYNSFNNLGWLESLPKSKFNKLEVFIGDVRDINNVKETTKDVDMVFHLAALIGIPYSYQAPQSYLETNIRGTMNMLQGCLENGVKKLLVTSTSEVYGTALYTPIDELHPRQGQSPYSATKIAADAMSEAFYRSFGLPVSIVRPFNTYGPRQSARAIIPTIITQLLSGKTELALGNVGATRDLVYVKDSVNGFIDIAKSDKTIGEEVNIATGTAISIKELAQELIEIINPKAKILCDKTRLRPANSEVEVLLGSNDKIKRLTGWEPRYSLRDGLLKTIEWFRKKENLKLYKSDIYNI